MSGLQGLTAQRLLWPPQNHVRVAVIYAAWRLLRSPRRLHPNNERLGHEAGWPDLLIGLVVTLTAIAVFYALAEYLDRRYHNRSLGFAVLRLAPVAIIALPVFSSMCFGFGARDPGLLPNPLISWSVIVGLSMWAIRRANSRLAAPAPDDVQQPLLTLLDRICSVSAGQSRSGWPAGLHGRVVLVYSAVQLVRALNAFATTAGPAGVLASSLFAAIAKLVMIVALAWLLDLRYGRRTTMLEAVLRIVAASIVVFLVERVVFVVSSLTEESVSVFGAAFATTAQLQDLNTTPYWIVVVLVSLSVIWTSSARVATASTPTQLPQPEPAPPAPLVPSPAQVEFAGHVDWPTTPPLAGTPPPVSTPPVPGTASPVAEPTTVTAAQKSKRSFFHRVSSLVILVAWILPGFAVLYLMNWCTTPATATTSAVLSFGYLGIQFFGNPVAGWVLDRRFGRTGGWWLALGRSLLVAVALAVVAFPLLVMNPTGGACG